MYELAIAEHANHLFVGRFGRDFVAEFVGAEDGGQTSFGSHVAVSVGKEGDEVIRAVAHGFFRIGHGLYERGVCAVVGECGEDIFHSDFEGDVHPPLQVETQVNLFFLAFGIGVFDQSEVVDDLRLHGVEVGLFDGGVSGGDFGGIATDAVRHERKRELKCAGDGQHNGQKLECAFILHG